MEDAPAAQEEVGASAGELDAAGADGGGERPQGAQEEEGPAGAQARAPAFERAAHDAGARGRFARRGEAGDGGRRQADEETAARARGVRPAAASAHGDGGGGEEEGAARAVRGEGGRGEGEGVGAGARVAFLEVVEAGELREVEGEGGGGRAQKEEAAGEKEGEGRHGCGGAARSAQGLMLLSERGTSPPSSASLRRVQ